MARVPNPGDYFANWRKSDTRFDQKLGSVIRNNWKKLRTASPCCGNHGSPGC